MYSKCMKEIFLILDYKKSHFVEFSNVITQDFGKPISISVVDYQLKEISPLYAQKLPIQNKHYLLTVRLRCHHCR